MRRPSRMLIASLAVLGMFTASCGKDDKAADSTTTTATVASSSSAAPTSAPSTTTAPITGALTVFAAASLTAAFNDIGSAFMTEHPDVKVTFSFAASSELVTQINQGAPADVFASADQSNMTKLTDAKNEAAAPVVFATNSAEIIVAPGNPKGITGVADLAKSDLIVVSCAAEVPCGKYAAQIFDKAKVTVTPKSLEANVKAVVAKVTLGEADAGIVYAIDVTAAADKAAGVVIPADLNVVAKYPIAVTKESANPAAAQAFVDFVAAEAGQKILMSYGFGKP